MLGAFLLFFWGAGLGKQGCLACRPAPWSTRSAFFSLFFFSAQCLPQLHEASSASLPLIALTCPATEACRTQVISQSLYGTFPTCLLTVETGSQDKHPYAANDCPAWQGEKKLLILHKTKMQRNSYGFLKNVTTTALSAAHPDSHSQALQAKACLLGYLSCFMQFTCSYHMKYKQYKVQLAVGK